MILLPVVFHCICFGDGQHGMLDEKHDNRLGGMNGQIESSVLEFLHRPLIVNCQCKIAMRGYSDRRTFPNSQACRCELGEELHLLQISEAG